MNQLPQYIRRARRAGLIQPEDDVSNENIRFVYRVKVEGLHRGGVYYDFAIALTRYRQECNEGGSLKRVVLTRAISGSLWADETQIRP